MPEAATFVDRETAQRLLLDHVVPGPTVRVALADALNRVLADPVVCDADYPPFERAMMDGYAVRAADIEAGTSTGRVDLSVVGQIAAGKTEERFLGRGEAMQINTGAPVPPGADAVIKVEDTELSPDGKRVITQCGALTRTNIDARGKYVAAGTVVLQSGARLTAGQMAVAAASGAAEVAVYRQPTVAILVTGDELIEVGDRLEGARIRNSNGPMLAAVVRSCFAQPIDLGVAGDDEGTLSESVSRGLEADILCVTGGISMGAFDLVPEVLSGCGVRTIVRRVRIKPGKPTTLGTTEKGTTVAALPGNPVSAFVAFWLFAGPVIEAREGRAGWVPQPVRARLMGPCRPAGDRESYWPARLTADAGGELTVEGMVWHGSGDPFGLANANGLIVRPPGSPGADAGDTVLVLPLERVT